MQLMAYNNRFTYVHDSMETVKSLRTLSTTPGQLSSSQVMLHQQRGAIGLNRPIDAPNIKLQRAPISPPIVSRGYPYPQDVRYVPQRYGITTTHYVRDGPNYSHNVSQTPGSPHVRATHDNRISELTIVRRRPSLLPPVAVSELSPGSVPDRNLSYGYRYTRIPYKDSESLVRVMPQHPNPQIHSHPGIDEQIAIKRPRLAVEFKSDPRQPLHVDIRESEVKREPAYNPQVEAISPTLPSEVAREESPLRSTKDELLRKISKADREIALAESQIAKLKKKSQELEDAAKKPLVKLEEREEPKEIKHQSLAQKIYAENRRKAQEAHKVLSKLGPKVELPLYNQPSDTTVYHENKVKHAIFKQRLIEYFCQKHTEKDSNEKNLKETYTLLMHQWLKKVEADNSQKRKIRDAKNREFFEKVFPELRKHREDRERFSRVGARIKSEADLEEIMDGLQEQEMEDKKMRSLTVIPPIMLDKKQRNIKYLNTNGLIDDAMQEYKDRQHLNLWTDAEKEVFKEKYLQHPKNFGLISSYLEKKSVSDCVQYYYMSKKKENYKQLLRKSRARNRARQMAKPTSNIQEIVSNSTGVTTRGSVAAMQREQQAQAAQKQTCDEVTTTNSSVVVSTSSSASGTVTTSTSIATSTTIIPTSVATTCVITPAVPSMSDVSQDTCQTGSPLAPSQLVTNVISGNASDEGSTNSNCSSFSSISNKKEDGKPQLGDQKSDKKIEKKKDIRLNESSDEDDENHNKGGGPHPCVVCKCNLENHSQSRSVLKSQAHQYGLSEDDVDVDARVCSSCRCKSVRRKYTQSSRCPIQTCPTVRWKVKRLRPFPAKWNEISSEMKDTIIKEYVIPENTTRCCSACFNRISRKIGVLLAEEAHIASLPSEWNSFETEKFRSAIRSVGLNWKKISDVMGKSSEECKSYYFSNPGKLNFEHDTKEQGTIEGKPYLVDENSGSTTVSCDETEVPGTLSEASSKPIQETPTSKEECADESSHVAGQADHKVVVPSSKEDYDSSATMSADEDQSNLIDEQSKASNNEQSPKEPLDFNQIKTLPHNPVIEQPPPTQDICLKDVIFETIKRTLKAPSVNTICTRPHASTSPTLQSILGTDPVAGMTKRDSSPVKVLKQEMRPPTSPHCIETTSLPQSFDYEVQDLSIKRERKERSPPRKEPVLLRRPPDVLATEGAKPPPAHSNILYSRPPDVPQVDHPFYTPRAKSPSIFVPDSRNMMQSPHVLSPSMARSASPQVVPHIRPVPSPVPKQKTAPPPLISSTKPGNDKSSLPPSGSITHGTPVMHSMVPSRYDGLLGIANTPVKDTGSITQGIPMHPDLKRNSAMPPPATKHPEVNTTIMYDPKPDASRSFERVEHYYKRTPQVAAFPSTFGTNGSRPPYVSEPLLSSRQIIMNDYITSQQMHGNKTEKDSRMSPRGIPDVRQEISKDSRDPSTRMMDPRYSLYYPPGSYSNQPSAYISHDSNRSPAARESTPVSTPPVSSPVTMWASTRSPLACQSSSPPQRQGVIQRTAVRPAVTKSITVLGKSESPDQYGSHHLPKSLSPRQQQFHPDHDAFNAFVNVAAAQPSLAVPKARDEKRNSLVLADRMRRDGRIDLREGLADSLARSMAVHGSGDRTKYGDTSLERLEKISDHRDDLQRYAQSFRRCDISRHIEHDKRQHIVVDKMYRNQPFSREQFERELKQDTIKDSQDVRKINSYPGPILSDRTVVPSTSKHGQESLLLSMKHDNRPKVTNTLTAANLFDAIITHQIAGENKSSDALFSKYKKCPETSSSTIEDGKQSPYQRVNPGSQSRSPTVKDMLQEEGRNEFPRPSSGHSSIKSITLGEHIENIITKDLSSSGSSEPLGSNPSYSQRILLDGNRSSPFRPMEGLYVETNSHNWKLRKALQSDNREPTREGHHSMGPDDRQIIRIAQTSPPKLEQKVFKPHTPPNLTAAYSVEPISPPVPPESNPNDTCYIKRPHHIPDSTENTRTSNHNKPQISPFDYVSSKIAEVMRTSDCGQQGDMRNSEDDRNRQTPRSNFHSPPVQNPINKPMISLSSTDRCSVPLHLSDVRVPLPVDLHRPYMTEERANRKQRVPHPENTNVELDENLRKKIRIEEVEGTSNKLSADSANTCDSDSKSSLETCAQQRAKDENPTESSQLADSPQSGEMVIDETCDNSSMANSVVPPVNTVGSTISYPTGNFTSSPIGGTSSLSSITLNYPYAFSALSVRSMPGVSDVSTSATNLAPTVSRSSEPAPLLSSQYEPLSDEE